MNSMRFFAHTPQETKQYAARVIRGCAARPRASALCIALEGELGAGKTTFVQGAAEALGITRPMPSPTFILMRVVALPKPFEGLKNLYHFDWYRLHRARDIEMLGWQEIVKDPANIVIVEWADKFPELLPTKSTWGSMGHSRNGRSIDIK